MVPAYWRVQHVLERFDFVSEKLEVARSAANLREVVFERVDEFLRCGVVDFLRFLIRASAL
jgi:hypothetical protein